VANYIGLDLAFSNNGFCCIDQDGNIIQQEVIVSKPIGEDESRLIFLSEKICNLIENLNPESVCIEGLSFGSKGQSISQIGALHYLVRIFLYKKKIKYQILTPSQLKKFITGVGNCKKELMLLKTYKKFGVEFDDNNLCDAYGLAQVALNNK
jgi:crossover junction endodeoxyribonuclease RuvC